MKSVYLKEYALELAMEENLTLQQGSPTLESILTTYA